MGAKCVITARNEERLQETLSQMAGDGHSIIIADIADDEERKKIADDCPVLNGVVHCAGIVKHCVYGFIKEKDFEHITKVNYFAPFLITQALLKRKNIENFASIVFVASISGVFSASAANSVYDGSKGALSGACKSMALDLSPKKIRVNCVCPGFIDTAIMHNLKDTTLTEEDLRRNIEAYPLKRCGKPEEVAYSVIYLLSDASAWVTGTNLLIDGGVSCK
jgi:NAD(P)-dependent dehydrogenase (short-subunit alcohol dehydrogenase family)